MGNCHQALLSSSRACRCCPVLLKTAGLCCTLQQSSTCCSSLECKCQEAHRQEKCQSSLHDVVDGLLPKLQMSKDRENQQTDQGLRREPAATIKRKWCALEIVIFEI